MRVFKRSSKHSSKSIRREKRDRSNIYDYPSPLDNRSLIQDSNQEINEKDFTSKPLEKNFFGFLNSKGEDQNNSEYLSLRSQTCRSLTKFKVSIKKKIDSLRKSNHELREETKNFGIRVQQKANISSLNYTKSLINELNDESEKSKSEKTIKDFKNTGEKGEKFSQIKILNEKVEHLTSEINILKHIIQNYRKISMLNGVTKVNNVFVLEESIGEKILGLLKGENIDKKLGKDKQILILECEKVEEKSKIMEKNSSKKIPIPKPIDKKPQEEIEKNNLNRKVLRKKLEEFRKSVKRDSIIRSSSPKSLFQNDGSDKKKEDKRETYNSVILSPVKIEKKTRKSVLEILNKSNQKNMEIFNKEKSKEKMIELCIDKAELSRKEINKKSSKVDKPNIKISKREEKTKTKLNFKKSLNSEKANFQMEKRNYPKKSTKELINGRFSSNIRSNNKRRQKSFKNMVNNYGSQKKNYNKINSSCLFTERTKKSQRWTTGRERSIIEEKKVAEFDRVFESTTSSRNPMSKGFFMA